MIRVDKETSERICQGDVYKDVTYIEYALAKGGIVEISTIVFPLVIALSQDYDLEQDYKFRYGTPKSQTQDKYLLTVLVAPLYNIEHFYDGEHLSELGFTMEKFERRAEKTANKYLKNNKIPRYHYLGFPDSIPIVPSVIDFKHYFPVDVLYLKKIKSTNFVCKVSELYREDISHRFACFLSRIGLPSHSAKV